MRISVTYKYILFSVLLSIVITSFLPATVDASLRGNWNWIYLCRHLDPILIPSCDNLVSPNNVLSSEGRRAIVCIQDGVTRAGGSQFLSELTPFAIIQILKPLSEPPKCVGIVKWANVDSVDIDGDRLKEIISIFS
jgi:hypothetical protein